jgi:hypothetical protein
LKEHSPRSSEANKNSKNQPLTKLSMSNKTIVRLLISCMTSVCLEEIPTA